MLNGVGEPACCALLQEPVENKWRALRAKEDSACGEERSPTKLYGRTGRRILAPAPKEMVKRREPKAKESRLIWRRCPAFGRTRAGWGGLVFRFLREEKNKESGAPPILPCCACGPACAQQRRRGPRTPRKESTPRKPGFADLGRPYLEAITQACQGGCSRSDRKNVVAWKYRRPPSGDRSGGIDGGILEAARGTGAKRHAEARGPPGPDRRVRATGNSAKNRKRKNTKLGFFLVESFRDALFGFAAAPT